MDSNHNLEHEKGSDAIGAASLSESEYPAGHRKDLRQVFENTPDSALPLRRPGSVLYPLGDLSMRDREEFLEFIDSK